MSILSNVNSLASLALSIAHYNEQKKTTAAVGEVKKELTDEEKIKKRAREEYAVQSEIATEKEKAISDYFESGEDKGVSKNTQADIERLYKPQMLRAAVLSKDPKRIAAYDERFYPGELSREYSMPSMEDQAEAAAAKRQNEISRPNATSITQDDLDEARRLGAADVLYRRGMKF